VRGGAYLVVAEVCPATGIGMSVEIAARAAGASINRTNQPLTREPPNSPWCKPLTEQFGDPGKPSA
jgi:hypothetical protein